MQVNGVTLPDIPADLLKTNPYAIIMQDNDSTLYMLFMSDKEFIVGNGSLLGMSWERVWGSIGAVSMYAWKSEYTEWVFFDKTNAAHINEITKTFEETLCWANHDIYEVTSLNLSTFAYTIGGIYFPDSENDERLSISRNILIHYAAQARRLSGTQEALKPEQTLEKYKDVIDIGELYGATIQEASHGTVAWLKDGLFEGCSRLTTVSFPAVTQVGDSAFSECTKLTSVNLPVVESLQSYVFIQCSAITKLNFPKLTSIGVGAFTGCTALETLILRSGTVCTIGANTFSNSAIASGTGYIYVPSTLVDSYKAATNWSAYAAQIRAIEDYPDICDTTM